jgi:two-component system, LuxR family, response regulator FixJ
LFHCRALQNQRRMSQETNSKAAKLVVVVVEDDAAVRGSLAFSLQTEGFSVRTYVSGQELLRDARAVHADCLVIDYLLPKMNGLDLLAELRRRQIGTPTILITTHPSGAVRERAAAAGIAVVEKPLLGDALFHEIRAALAK